MLWGVQTKWAWWGTVIHPLDGGFKKMASICLPAVTDSVHLWSATSCIRTGSTGAFADGCSEHRSGRHPHPSSTARVDWIGFPDKFVCDWHRIAPVFDIWWYDIRTGSRMPLHLAQLTAQQMTMTSSLGNCQLPTNHGSTGRIHASCWCWAGLNDHSYKSYLKFLKWEKVKRRA